MTANEIYDHFRINRGLREHMLRVAAVAKLIGNKIRSGLATDMVVSAALVHDLGNIVKTNFEVGGDLFEPEGIEYWRQVKEEVVATYGANDAEATKAMQLELGLFEDVMDIAGATGLKHISAVEENGTAEQKLMMYADLRVGIHGVVSLAERFDDIAVRYVPEKYSEALVASGQEVMTAIEAELFSDLALEPVGITDEAIGPLMEGLKQWQIKTRI